MTVLENPIARAKRRNATVRHRVTSAAKTLAGRAIAAVPAARARLRRPVLTLGALGCISAAFYQHGWFAGLLATGICLFVFEMLGGEQE